jgi:hypothetical protein
MLAEQQAHGLQPNDGRDLLVKLEGIRADVDGMGGEHATEAGQLLQLVI